MWKEDVKEGWVIMCDMDEWLDINENELIEEDSKDVTIIQTQGWNMVGESKTNNADDIELSSITKGFLDENFSKKICFKYPNVVMEYWYGAHKAFPYGHVNYSDRMYLLKHYNYLGESYLIHKNKKRYERNEKSRNLGMNQHYLWDENETRTIYQNCLERSIIVPSKP
jgi:hypothetical protein